jgi:hypothetical protein
MDLRACRAYCTFGIDVSLDQCVIVWGASSGVIMVCVYSSNTQPTTPPRRPRQRATAGLASQSCILSYAILALMRLDSLFLVLSAASAEQYEYSPSTSTAEPE